MEIPQYFNIFFLGWAVWELQFYADIQHSDFTIPINPELLVNFIFASFPIPIHRFISYSHLSFIMEARKDHYVSIHHHTDFND